MLAAPLRRTCFPTLATAARTLPRAAKPAVAMPVRSFQSSSMLAAVKTRFTTEHEWIAYDDQTNVGTIGITDHAQNSLGDVVFIELPEKKLEVAVGDQIGSVESVKAASDIYSPVSGVVVDTNMALDDQPNLLNKDPHDKGWLAKIQLANPGELDELLSEEAYKATLD